MEWVSLRFRCTRCGREERARPERWRCDCGGPWGIAHPPRLRRREWGGEKNLARYLPALRAPLGEGLFLREMSPTPLEHRLWQGQSLWLKAEYRLPTGSFKVRGAAVLVEALREAGASLLVEDSSGNAGLAIATLARQAGLACRLFVPASVPAGKRRLLEATGACLVLVEGSREKVAQAAQEAVRALPGAVYASHVWNPLFIEGVQTLLWEVWEQMGGELPEALFLPVGNGTLLLGVWWGLQALQEAGYLERWPQLVGVQAEACAPLARAWERSQEEPVPVEPGATQADGIRIAAPPRGREILQAVAATGGTFLTVSEAGIEEARRLLADWGHRVEPTGAVALAGWLRWRREGLSTPESALIPLTGSAKDEG